ncbi:adenosylcobinamide-GDP ribazoletransferase [Neobacillus mesonae]|nr:adenosylcobinamide-GDP ribazoletransferase [Neobacillus mesonae]
MKEQVKAAAAAFQFLSRFPIKMNLDFTPELMRKSTVYYPIVGACIGLVVWIAAALSGLLLPALPASIIVLTLWVWLTGGLHLDGWMDSADALLSYRSRERMLEIMKDSRVGAMGVIACVLLLMLKASLIVSLIDEPMIMGWAIQPMIWSRCFMVYAMMSYPSARAGEGLAGMFGNMEAKLLYKALLWSFILSVVFLGASILPAHEFGAISVSLLPMLLVLVAVPIVMWAVGKLAADRMSKRLGGLTGDTYGALNEGLEAVGLLILVMILHAAS